jgi:hypothetical protein
LGPFRFLRSIAVSLGRRGGGERVEEAVEERSELDQRLVGHARSLVERGALPVRLQHPHRKSSAAPAGLFPERAQHDTLGVRVLFPRDHHGATRPGMPRIEDATYPVLLGIASPRSTTTTSRAW